MNRTLKKKIRRLLSLHTPLILNTYDNVRLGRQYNEAYWQKTRDRAIGLARQIEAVPYPKLLRQTAESAQRDHRTDNSVVEINNFCNINCRMCRTDLSTRKKTSMDMALFDMILGRLSAYGIKRCGLHTIGDPLANPKLPEILDRMRRRGMTTSISTNGLLLHRHIETLRDYKDVCTGLRFSIEGATREVYERIRTGGNWDVLHTNLALAKEQLLASDYIIKIASVVSRDNIGELGTFIVHFRQYVNCPHRDLVFGFLNSLCPDSSYFEEHKLLDKHVHSHVPCMSTVHPMPFILVDGSVTVCCRDYDGSMVIGNISEQDLSDIYRGHKIEKLRTAHMKGDVSEFPLCKDCRVVDKRIAGMFSLFMEFMMHQYPKGDAVTYQQLIDKFLSICGKNRNLERETGALWDSIADARKRVGP